MRMTRDELEYAISQYLDGVLPELERAALEERLASDAEARAVLQEYQRLDVVLKSSLPAPQVQWDVFSKQLDSVLDAAEAPVRHDRLLQGNWMRMAIAAGILLVVGLSIPLLNLHRADDGRPRGVAVISGPSMQQAAGPVVAEIQVGPSPSMALAPVTDDEILVRPSVVLIDPVNISGQDSDLY